MADAPLLSKAERLAIGGAVAPVVRTARARPIKLVNKDGETVGVTSTVEVAKSLLRRSEIEFSTQEGERPKFVNCKTCGRPVKVSVHGDVLPLYCRPGIHKCQCGTPLNSRGRCNFGRQCKACGGKARMSALGIVSAKNSAEDFAAIVKLCPSWRDAGMALGTTAKSAKKRAARLGITLGDRAST